MPIPYYAHSGRRKHLWRLRSEGHRDLLVRHDWLLKGGYCEKSVRGRTVMLTMVERHANYCLVRLCDKEDFWAEATVAARAKDALARRAALAVVEVGPPHDELKGPDLGFRPKSYFWPMGVETHLLANIKGAERRASLQRLVERGRLDAAPPFLSMSALSDEERSAVGSLSPTFMGGGFLPDLARKEVMVARITVASTTQDVTCVYARRRKHRIHYRVVDEYAGETLTESKTRSSVQPLTLGDLEAFLHGAWSIFQVLEANFARDGYKLDEMLAFVRVESEFYPELGQLYRHRIAAWSADKRG